MLMCLKHVQGLNPDHAFIAAAGEDGVQDDREKEMEENMNEVKLETKRKSTIVYKITNCGRGYL